MAFPCRSTCFLYRTYKDTLLGYSCCIPDLYVSSDVLQKLKSHGSNDLQRERFRGRCCWPQSSCGLSHKAAAWLLMGKLGAECLTGLLGRTAASSSLPHDFRSGLTVQVATRQQNINILLQKHHKCWQQNKSIHESRPPSGPATHVLSLRWCLCPVRHCLGPG